MPSSSRRRGIVVKTSPALWEASKRRACTEAKLCLHSARKMQWAVRDYKRRGGKYAGRPSPSNKLARWTKQKWRTSDGAPSRGRTRYLPDAAWAKLSADQVRRTNAAKRRGAKSGKQYVPQPADVRATLSKERRRRRGEGKQRRQRRNPFPSASLT